MNPDTLDIIQMRDSAEEASGILKIMAHPVRLMILCQLTQGEIGVGELQNNALLSQSAFSQHLTVLRKNHLIKARKVSQQVFYSLADARIDTLIECFHAVFCRRAS
ncbi:ArsR/SmtB family transcription factor [Vibrio neptunius]|uniref:ArsR/SmtB family transcription factor n=1 Tax=Vibrio neptunius TaxID=170651 RepID=UPI0019CFB617|nr:metalloregulator ArsR/SmtB family transcription factor [Vibrio neptunius]MBN3572169.1 helix-turn-helix transcriptional regulator [Vibrio neptunius]QXX08619.1 metalloregulator ArsR/SmtB family transcription factor [Vibrio neptunius]